MATIYTGQGPSMSTDSDTSIDTIHSWMQAYQSNQRADSQLAMQEAEHKYSMGVQKQLKNSTDALNTYSNEGYDWQSLASGNNTSIFAMNLPDDGMAFKQYQVSQAANGTTADMATFMQKRQQNGAFYMNNIIKKHNALRATVQQNNPNSSEDDINRYMAKFYAGDKVYENATQVFGNPAESGLVFQPVDVDEKWYKDIWSAFYSPEVSGAGGTAGGKLQTKSVVGAGAAVVGAGTGIYKGVGQYQAGSADYLKQAQDDWAKYKQKKTKITKGKKKGQFKLSKAEGSGLESKDFIKKYGMNKKALGGAGKEFVATEASKAGTRAAGRGATWPAKTKDWMTEKGTALKGATPESAKNVLSKAKSMAKTGAWYGGVNMAGSALGEAFGGEVGGEVGEMATLAATPALRTMYSNVRKKISDKGMKWALGRIMKKGGWKLAAKVAAKGAIGSVGGAFTGGIATGASVAWVLKDLYDIARILEAD